jgi:hypothetical protein
VNDPALARNYTFAGQSAAAGLSVAISETTLPSRLDRDSFYNCCRVAGHVGFESQNFCGLGNTAIQLETGTGGDGKVTIEFMEKLMSVPPATTTTNVHFNFNVERMGSGIMVADTRDVMTGIV